MNEKYILAKHIRNRIKEVKPTNTAAFKNVVDEYNKLASLVNDENIIPFESSFNDSKDIKLIRGSYFFTTNGLEKKERIQSRCELYVAKQSCRRKLALKIFIGIISFLFSGIGLFFIQQCNDSEKKDAITPINLNNKSSYQPQQNINIINGNNNTISNSNNLQENN